MTNNPVKELENLITAVLRTAPCHYEGHVKAVGGYARDEYTSFLKGTEFSPKDLDIVVSLKEGGSQEFSLFLRDLLGVESTGEPRQMGASYPIWQMAFRTDVSFAGSIYRTKGAVVEFADTMKESYPSGDSRQRAVGFSSLAEDIKRRDFTVNMLLKDLTTGLYEDSVSARESIMSGTLTHHPEVNPEDMFNDDPLRLLRMVRFCVLKDYDPTVSLVIAARKASNRLNIVSAERIQEELNKILIAGKLKSAIELMDNIDILKVVFPEVSALKGVEQDELYHSEGCVYTHTLMVLDQASPGVVNQLSALLHDIGKPATQEYHGLYRIKFIGHEDLSAKMSEVVLTRLKYSNEIKDRIVFAVANHIRPLTLSGPNTTGKAYRKFIRDMGSNLEDVMELTKADCLGRTPQSLSHENLMANLVRVQEQDKALAGSTDIKKFITGKDIMEHLSLSTGPEVGRAVALARDLIDDSLSAGVTPNKLTILDELKIWFPIGLRKED